MKGTWQTDSSSGGGALVLAIAVAVVAGIVAAVAVPVINAVTELLRVLLITVAVVAGVAVAALTALLVWRRSHPAVPPWMVNPPPVRAIAQRQEQQALPQGGQHVHFHLAPGMTRDDLDELQEALRRNR